jgi:hypothetical protein
VTLREKDRKSERKNFFFFFLSFLQNINLMTGYKMQMIPNFYTIKKSKEKL